MGLSLPGFSRSSSSALLGVDLSTHRVKVVELAQEGRDRVRLERYAIEPIEAGAIVDGQIEKPEVVAAALTRAIRRSGSKARNAALALPSSAVIAKRILLPAGLSEDDYEVQVESEASQVIPFSMDEVNLDFQVLGPAEGSEEDVEVLLAASRRERVEDRVALAEMAGLKPVIIDVEPFAARRVIDRLYRPPRTGGGADSRGVRHRAFQHHPDGGSRWQDRVRARAGLWRRSSDPGDFTAFRPEPGRGRGPQTHC